MLPKMEWDMLEEDVVRGVWRGWWSVAWFKRIDVRGDTEDMVGKSQEQTDVFMTKNQRPTDADEPRV
jgi:hypothetical protein